MPLMSSLEIIQTNQNSIKSDTMKVLLLLALFGTLLYLFWRRFSMGGSQTAVSNVRRPNTFLPIESSAAVFTQAARGTLWTVASGFILLILILVIGLKIKILWLMLPLSLYLIGQLFVYTNHVRASKDQRIFYDPQTGEVLIDFLKKDTIVFNLKKDIISVNEVKSVQKNKGTLFGYYKLATTAGTVVLPYLLEQHTNSVNRDFFAQVNTYKRNIETKLFPII